MVIRRFDTRSGQPDRRTLGRVEVTIDDLHALLELLRARPDIETVVVGFDEGEFDAAVDIRELSDGSLKLLRVRADDLTVTLGDAEAIAVGPAELTEYVYNAWARSRQTRSHPSNATWIDRNGSIVSLILTLGFGAFIGVLVLTNDNAPPGRSLPGLLLIYAVIALGVWVGYRSNKQVWQRRHFARLIPRTSDDVRVAREERSVVPTWSLVVSGLLLIVSLTFNILNYIRLP